MTCEELQKSEGYKGRERHRGTGEKEKKREVGERENKSEKERERQNKQGNRLENRRGREKSIYCKERNT